MKYGVVFFIWCLIMVEVEWMILCAEELGWDGVFVFDYIMVKLVIMEHYGSFWFDLFLFFVFFVGWTCRI